MQNIIPADIQEVVLVLLNDYCSKKQQPGPNSIDRIKAASVISSYCPRSVVLFTAGRKRSLSFDTKTFGEMSGVYAETSMGVQHVIAQNDDSEIKSTLGEVIKAIDMINEQVARPGVCVLRLVSNPWHAQRALVGTRLLYPDYFYSGPKIETGFSSDKPEYKNEIASWMLLAGKYAGIVSRQW